MKRIDLAFVYWYGNLPWNAAIPMRDISQMVSHRKQKAAPIAPVERVVFESNVQKRARSNRFEKAIDRYV